MTDFDTFEDGSVSDWTDESGSDFQIESTVVNSGSYAAKQIGTTDNVFAYKSTGGFTGDYNWTFYIRSPGYGNGETRIICIDDGTSGEGGICLMVKEQGGLKLYTRESGLDTAIFTMVDDTWYKVLVTVHWSTSTYDVDVDDVNKATGVDFLNSITGMDYFKVGTGANCEAADILYIDDISYAQGAVDKLVDADYDILLDDDNAASYDILIDEDNQAAYDILLDEDVAAVYDIIDNTPSGNIVVSGRTYPEWTHRGYIAIANPSSTDGFEANVTIPWHPAMQADYADIRFTDRYGNRLPYWIRSKTDGSTADIWVALPANDTYIHYYFGNGQAVSESKGEDVFVFFDDFEQDTVAGNPSKWTIADDDPDINIVSSPAIGNRSLEIEVDTVSPTPEVYADVTAMTTGFLEFSGRVDLDSDGARMLLREGASERVRTAFDNEYGLGWYYDAGAGNVLIKTINVDTWYNFGIDFDCGADTADFYVNGTKEVTAGGFYSAATTNIDEIRLWSYYNRTQKTYIDNVFMRHHATTYPSLTTGKIQINPNYPRIIAVSSDTGVNKTFESVYDMLLDGDNSAGYDILLDSDKAAIYDVLLNGTPTASYDILINVDKVAAFDCLIDQNPQVVYDILFNSDKAAVYDVLLDDTNGALYDILLNGNHVASYDMLLDLDKQAIYDLLVNLEPDVVYDILLDDDKAASYDILLDSDPSAIYDVHLNTSVQALYDILGAVEKLVTAVYDILLDEDKVASYDILADAAGTEAVYDILLNGKPVASYDIILDTGKGAVYDILVDRTSQAVFDILLDGKPVALYDVSLDDVKSAVYDILLDQDSEGIYDVLLDSDKASIYDIHLDGSVQAVYDIRTDDGKIIRVVLSTGDPSTILSSRDYISTLTTRDSNITKEEL